MYFPFGLTCLKAFNKLFQILIFDKKLRAHYKMFI